MNYVLSAMLVAGLLMVTLAPDTGLAGGSGAPESGATLSALAAPPTASLVRPSSTASDEPSSTTPDGLSNTAPQEPSISAPDDVVQEYCVRCHNDRMLRGNLSLEGFTLDAAEQTGAVTERMIRLLRADMMPPPGARRPSGDSLLVLVESLEEHMDQAAAANPNPGGRTFQRLNRAEYERSIYDLFGLRVDAGDYLPLDTKSAKLRQYCRRADGVAHVARRIPQRRGGNQSPGGRRRTRDRERDTVQDPTLGVPDRTRRGRAVRHPGRHIRRAQLSRRR